jgi:transcriptional regulator
MSAPKPTLGYPSRTAAVLDLRRQGLRDTEIAARIDIPVQTVAALGASAKRRARPAETHGRTVVIPTDILDRLAPHATTRGISTNELVRRLVETALDEGLIDAVLDDTELRA